jgi:uncharacterized protein YjdB
MASSSRSSAALGSGKTRLRFAASALSIALILNACADNAVTTGPPLDDAPARIQLSKASMQLDRGDTSRVDAVIVNGAGVPLASPSAGTPRSSSGIAWSSSDPSIADVSRSGLVLAQRAGEATIYANSGNLSSSSRVVVQPRGRTLTVAPRVDTLHAVGHKLLLTATVLNPAGRELTDATTTWNSLNPEVAEVDQAGTVQAVAAGTAAIVVAAQGQADTARVVVRNADIPPPPVAAFVELTPAAPKAEVGSVTQLVAVVRDGSGTVMTGVPIVWSSSDSDIATVDNHGLVTARAAGAAMIRATADGKSGATSFTVKPLPTPAFIVPASIDGTGTKDVTAEINAWIASVPDGNTLRFRNGARYRIEGTILLEERNGLTVEGEGAEFFVTVIHPIPNPTSSSQRKVNRTRSHWSVQGGSDIVVRNLSIVGPHPAAGTGSAAYVSDLEAQHGFDIGGVKGITLDNVRVTDVFGDFVYLSRWQTDSNWVDGAIIQNSHFERNGRQGVGITGARNVLFEGNWIGEVRRSVFDIEPNTERGGAENITIRNNTIGEARLRYLAAHGRAGRVANIVIEGNQGRKAMNITVESPVGSRRGPFRIVNNRASEGYGTPRGFLMRFVRVDGLEISRNRNPLQSGRDMRGVTAEESCDVDIQDNEFPGGIGDYVVAPFDCGN